MIVLSEREIAEEVEEAEEEVADSPPISARCLELLAANQRASSGTRAYDCSAFTTQCYTVYTVYT